MPESLEEFLKGKNYRNSLIVSGSLSCQECDEIVNNGQLDEETMILVYRCSKGHESRVKM